ncbi:hypothetical protein IJJ49_01440 [Candidatus Saccharibacteria bacterium]|nr:hypothetical protein [Candidatus Saccharibacteria bacterium]
MDNGHAANQPIFSPPDTSTEEGFFTPGVGNLPADFNPDRSVSLNIEIPPAPTPAPEFTPDAVNAADAAERLVGAAEIGKIVDFAPPVAESDTDNPIAALERSISFNKAELKTSNNLSKAGVREVDKVLHSLDKTEDIANFYAAVREMTKTHLDNSYGQNSAWKDAA